MRAAGRAVAACAVTCFVACSPARIPPPSAPAPTMDRPSASIPADLDVVMRLDVAAARRFFGPAISGALDVDVVDVHEDEGTARYFAAALGRAEVVWVALRPGHTPKLTDDVVIVKGDFSSITPPHEGAGAWEMPADLGSGFRLYRRAPPARRSAPSRIYARADDWLVFVSEAEVDSAERAIELRAGDDHLDPPERGIASFAARAPAVLPFLSREYPLVVEALDGADRLEGSAEADDRGLRASISAKFASETDAAAGKERLAPLLTALREKDGFLGLLARGTEMSVLGSTLVVQTTLDGAGLAKLITCFDGKGC